MQEIGEFRQMLLEQLASAEGMEALAQAAAAFLKEPFAVCDAAYTLMVTTAPHQNDGVFVVQSSQRRIMRPEIVEEMQNKGILERLQKSREAFSIYNTSCGMWEIFCVLAIHGQVAGYLFLRTAQEPDEARLEAWTTLGQALSVELQKGEYATPGPLQPIQSRILRQLMEGEISQENLILHRLRQTGWKPSQSYRLETQPKLPAGLPGLSGNLPVFHPAARTAAAAGRRPAAGQPVLFCPGQHSAAVSCRPAGSGQLRPDGQAAALAGVPPVLSGRQHAL